MNLAADRVQLRSILIRPIDILTSRTRIDHIMASSAPTIGAVQHAKVGSPGPISRVVIEAEAALADDDDPDPSLSLNSARSQRARSASHVPYARTTGHSGGFSQEHPDPHEHAHSECGERP